MAVEGEGEEAEEYESDPEDALRPSAMRRRAASDDEEGEASDGGGGVLPERRGKASDGDEEEEFDEGEEELEEEGEEELEEEEEEAEPEEWISEGGGIAAVAVPDSSGDGRRSGGDENLEGGEEEGVEKKKENEPSAVPTAGAFYMHDDRFRENGRGRPRRMPGAQNLWESKDDRAWVHDRFEEMNLQDSRYDEQRRTSKGRFRGRGNSRSRGTDHGYTRGNSSRASDNNNGYNNRSGSYDESNNLNRGYTRGNRSRASDDNNNNNNRPGSYDESNNQNRAPRSVKGRGPRRYEPFTKNISEISASQSKRYTDSHESISSTSAGTQSSHSSNLQPGPVLPRKHIFASSLNSASPPFYPSVSSNKDISVTQKRDTRTGSNSKTGSSPMQMRDNFSSSQSSSLLRGKALSDSVGHNSRHMDDSIRPVTGKSPASSQLQSAGSSLSSTSPTQSHSRFQGRGVNTTGPMNHQSSTPVNQITRASSQTHIPLVPQRPVQTPVQAVMQQMSQRASSGIQTPSPPHAPSVNTYDVGETTSPPGASKPNNLLVGKGKISNQGGSGSGSFLYSGASQVLGATGAMGLAHSDQSFPGTPALLPVMQFGGQHHGGLAVGMALPGYVAQPQHGFGNSEMTWLPVMAGAAGALGASYCSPYITLDSSSYALTSGQRQTSSSTSSREAGTKPANTLKSPQEPGETVSDESGQRQNKPRRYSEMNFGQ